MPNKIQFKGGAHALLSAFDGTKLFVMGNGATVSIELGDALKKLAHKPHEYMGAVRTALKLHELADPAECAEGLEKLRGRVDACLDDEGNPDTDMRDGVDLGSFVKPLKELVDAQPGDTWNEVFDAVQALIQAAIEEHEVRDHSGAAPQMNATDAPAVSAEPPATQPTAGASPAPATPNATEPPMPTAATPAPDAVKLTDLENRVNEFTLQMTAVQGKLTEQAGVIAAKDEEIKTLTADLKKRDAEKATSRVEEAFQTYQTKMNLTDAHKPQMALYLSSSPAEFEKLYPRVPGALQHLLADLTGGRPQGSNGAVGAPVIKLPSLGELAIKVAQERRIELADAQCIVFAAAQRARAQAAAA